MAIKLILFILLQYDIPVQTIASIAGVTYMDDFDFEDRYRNINECNPLHWHPLHMPEHCAKMYEKFIRSGIKYASYPKTSYEIGSSEEEYYDESYSETMPYISYDTPTPPLKHHKRTPYQKMLDLLKKDIRRDPSSPTLGIHPNFGPVAIYNQEISKKSASMIKELATAYAKYGQQKYGEYLGYNESPNPQLYVWDSNKNNTKNDKNVEKDKYGDRVSRTKTKNGGIVTIVETLKPRRRRKALYWYDI